MPCLILRAGTHVHQEHSILILMEQPQHPHKINGVRLLLARPFPRHCHPVPLHSVPEASQAKTSHENNQKGLPDGLAL